MKAGLRVLLSRIIDYAGLFPPAKLPLEEAIHNYARYRTGSEGWMLGRFICPAARLAELEPFASLFQSGPPFAFSALGRGGATRPEFLDGLRADLAEVEAFRGRYGDRVVVDVFEVRLPADVLPTGDRAALESFFATFRSSLDGLDVAPFYEAEPGPGWRGTLAALIPTLPGGFKLRCGGLEAAAFPTPEQVAFTLVACARAGRPFKATAGLHHPLRHFDRALGVPMHGFLNVFGAGVLAAVLDLTEEQLRPIVEDEDAAHFQFTDTAFHWKDHAAPLDAIARARAERVISFGSCSFDEPRADLRTLGLL